jgi:YbgC/YbaW family acyl-CoA thioester hydrolase
MAMPHVSTERVRWADVDLVGIARFSCFTRFVEHAEQEWMRAAGLPYAELFRAPELWLPRRHLALDYVAPARLDEALAMVTYVTRLGDRALTFQVDMFGLAADDLKVTATLVIVAVDRGTFTKRSLPDWLRDAVRPFVMEPADARAASAPRRRALAGPAIFPEP